MIILTCDNSVCKRVTIPSPNKIVNIPNVVSTITLPEGLKIASANVNYGSVTGNVWTIPTLPAGEDAVLDVCFNPEDCNVAPTGKVGSVTVSTTANETNLGNNTMSFTLNYITCDEINTCEKFKKGTEDVFLDINGEASIDLVQFSPLPETVLFSIQDAGEMRTVHLLSVGGGGTNYNIKVYNAAGPVASEAVRISWMF